jgi:hypothetical protein
MFETIEQLIDYYQHSADGLPGKLTRPVEPIDQATKGLKSLIIAQGGLLFSPRFHCWKRFIVFSLLPVFDPPSTGNSLIVLTFLTKKCLQIFEEIV